MCLDVGQGLCFEVVFFAGALVLAKLQCSLLPWSSELFLWGPGEMPGMSSHMCVWLPIDGFVWNRRSGTWVVLKHTDTNTNFSWSSVCRNQLCRDGIEIIQILKRTSLYLLLFLPFLCPHWRCGPWWPVGFWPSFHHIWNAASSVHISGSQSGRPQEILYKGYITIYL